MSNVTERYDTLVIRGASGKEVPRMVDGGEVVSWAAGHAVAEASPVLEYVSDLAREAFGTVGEIADEARRVLALSKRQRQQGWLDQEQAEAAAEPQETVEELREALVAESQRYNDLYLQHTNFVAISQKVGQDLAVMCEAYLAGDSETASTKLRDFARAYQKNTRPTDGKVH
ncbi:hypothetical protein LOY46_11150 [Pseudomonas sichuanensis]|uniref:hypothetical protein n=1 Tax=Pseudomonas sichuanensis TaxID=2213015 RepID=UPI00215F9FA2|nr:hypothetical protein [Pseudomonas sichuanensis]UVK85200.1 hypothetical protein LOY46_11150 [Pseudomonas sichuanensis]